MKRIIAVVVILLLILLLFWIVFTPAKDEAGDSSKGSQMTPGSSTAQSHIVLNQKRYPLTVLRPCGYGADGQFHLLAVTLDESGVPLVDGPQFLIQSAPWETIADFYSGEGDVHRISQRGDNRMALEGGRLIHGGQTDGANAQPIKIHLVCPDSAS